MLKESIFFYQLGIGVVRYSTIQDILLSPVADVVSEPVVFVGILFVLLIVFLYMRVLSGVLVRKSMRKRTEEQDPDEVRKAAGQKVSVLLNGALAFGVLCFFVGAGLGAGIKTRNRIENNQMEFKHRVSFGTGETEEIFLIESNSAYCFYITKGGKNIKIAPMGAIKNLELIVNRKLGQKD